jgi:hypothetical protein
MTAQPVAVIINAVTNPEPVAAEWQYKRNLMGDGLIVERSDKMKRPAVL